MSMTCERFDYKIRIQNEFCFNMVILQTISALNARYYDKEFAGKTTYIYSY